jgi:hypothetical protein
MNDGFGVASAGIGAAKRLARRIQGNAETIRGCWFAQVCEFRLR